MSAPFRLASAIAVAALSAQVVAAPHYTSVDIGSVRVAKQINGEGDVIGVLKTNLPAIYKSSTGQWEALADKNNYAPESVNNHDVVVGERNYGSRGRPHAIVIKSSGKVSDLLRSRESYATVIHDDGTAYGSAQPFAGATFPFIWRGGEVTSLPPLEGYNWTLPVAATKSGVIAANGLANAREPDCPMEAAIYSGSTWQSLGTLGGNCAMAQGMNDLGDVVGWSKLADNQTNHGFVWHDGVMTDIGSLAGGYSVAFDINSSGVVVGWDADPEGNTLAMIYQNGVMSQLDNLVDDRQAGTSFFEAISINESGQILAYGTTADFSVDTFILTPLP
jgi:probable HAF family extracellular repeat protein